MSWRVNETGEILATLPSATYVGKMWREGRPRWAGPISAGPVLVREHLTRTDHHRAREILCMLTLSELPREHRAQHAACRIGAEYQWVDPSSRPFGTCHEGLRCEDTFTSGHDWTLSYGWRVVVMS